MPVVPEVAQLIERINAFSVSDRLKREANHFAKAWLTSVPRATISVSQIVDSVHLEWRRDSRTVAISFLTGLPPRQMYLQRIDENVNEPAETALRVELTDQDAIHDAIAWLENG